MWALENRPRYDRDKLRYPSDLTDDKWALVAPLIPPAKHGGRRRSVDVREVVNGLMYVLSTGCQWRYIPKDLPPKSTIFAYFDLWTYHGVGVQSDLTLMKDVRLRSVMECCSGSRRSYAPIRRRSPSPWSAKAGRLTRSPEPSTSTQQPSIAA